MDEQLMSINGQVAAIRTVNSTSWEMLKVRLFGMSIKGIDTDDFGKEQCIVHAKLYKGKMYLLRYEDLGDQNG